jgi:uncharacterized protein YbaP (TraB family)
MIHVPLRGLSALVAGCASLLCAAALAVLAPGQEPAAAAPAPGERPFLWRIEGPQPSYLFGTIHVPDPRVTALHPEVEAALDAVDALYAELPMETAMGGATLRRMALPGRERLADLLGPELHGRLAAYLEARGMSAAPFQRLKIWVVATQLQLLDDLGMMRSGKALDLQLYERARDEGLEVGGLETVDEQVAVFEGLSRAEQTQLLRDALDQLEAAAAAGGESLLQRTIRLYLAGDADALLELMHERRGADEALEEKLEEALLWARNRRMAERIDAKLREAPERSFFFAVGAAHYPGREGLLELLRRRGHRITRLPETAAAVEARIRALEAELDALRARLAALRKAG